MAKKKKKKTAKRNDGAPNTSALSAQDKSATQSETSSQVVEAEFVGDNEVKTSATAAAVKTDAVTSGSSPFDFLKGSREELSKVVWPDRQQLISESAAVILMVSFLAILISFIDNLFSWASQLVF